jgi:predicted transcriptional regulator
MDLKKEQDPWQIAQGLVAELPPYLEDDELTVRRYYERNKETISMQDAERILKDLVEAGVMERQPRRQKKGGSRIFVYVMKGKKK